MNIEEFIRIIKESKSFSEVSKKIYGNTYYGNRQTIKKRIEEFSINISHFDYKKKYNKSLGYNRYKKIPNEDVFISGSTYNNTTSLKKRLYEEKIKEPICEKCGQNEWWNGNKMSLILDHINGVNNDNRLENLRILCPNCNATLPTHCGKNIKLKSNKLPRKKYYIKKSINEVKNINKKRSFNQRKVKRPSYEILLKEIKEIGYNATGRKYCVSDNTIRKWVKFYEKYD